ncbi:MAG TPA: hypothetical protein VMV91_18490 [Rhodocyclaceae bacterium]|nr:hypothetical protein [Rhodocyclaceae bacterium]
MKTPAWIAGSLLILAVSQPVSAQQASSQQAPSIPQQLIRFPGHLLGIISNWLPHSASGGDAQAPADKAQQVKRASLSEAERLQLRQDVNEAGRDIYRHEPPAHHR